MPPIKTKGINLKFVRVGEADKILTIFTSDLGKISAIAKGARRPRSKFGGRLEPFAFNNYLLATGRSLYVVSQAETIESFRALREEEQKLRAACFIVNVVRASTEEGQKNPALFDLLLKALDLLNVTSHPESIKLIFEVLLMEVEGFFPYLEGCIKCRKPVTKEPSAVTFSIAFGGLLCSACAKTAFGKVSVPFPLIKMMKRIRESDVLELKDIQIEQGNIKKLNTIVRPYISDHIGKDIRNW
jgi:DNA repair protein RecO (recombination protein O)